MTTELADEHFSANIRDESLDNPGSYNKYYEAFDRGMLNDLFNHGEDPKSRSTQSWDVEREILIQNMDKIEQWRLQAFLTGAAATGQY